eukprot:6911251-Prymnesium_polylepis.1
MPSFPQGQKTLWPRDRSAENAAIASGRRPEATLKRQPRYPLRSPRSAKGRTLGLSMHHGSSKEKTCAARRRIPSYASKMMTVPSGQK